MLEDAKSKPPYLLGLLGLIPLVGAFVGIALVLYGILKYKDRLLIIIGSACILFTVVIYSSLFVYLNSETARKGFIEISQSFLNTLSRDIEVYKLEHKRYPDSLTQLVIEDKMAPINDPTKKMSSSNSYFNYKNLGEKYLLFSSGVDQIENTADDIYPNIKNSDSSLIKYHFIIGK